ncbi:hypothetical protein HPB51_024492 [Rhipicephalus microplus]|uniref:Transglutaminase-like domain-containing protein n=1 Tax=Rhipicephalus microplus TaxID=6941 RepID=A0A9J6DDT7_RHIMP|nr:hypothetical protein HPB51_024492 [Rhipicephalus microplus]
MREGTTLMGHTSGASPSESDGTLVTLTAPHAVDQEGKVHETVDRWTMSVSFHNNDIMLLKFRTPAKAPVGRWSLSFRLGDGSATPAKTPIYIICNPWLPEDPVYLKDEAERNFYTMKETGAYYYGSEKNFGQREWNYGQFEKVTLATIEFLLKAVVADGVQRSDCVSLVRALCAAINVQDDQGLLIGRWSDDYSAGTSPSVWSSTMPILNKYMESGGNSVKYGQCFVFASALVTVLRALGIPSRSVSNFPSAHVEGDDMSLDFYFDEKNKAIEGADMEWCGRLILTEKFNPNGGRLQPDDITHTYKGPAAQPRGATTDLIQVRLEHEKLVPVGQSGRVLCTITNNDLEEHRVGLALTAYSAPYSNVRPNALVSAQRDFCLQAGSSDALELLISPECYVSKLCPEVRMGIERRAFCPFVQKQVSRKETPVGALAYKLTMKNPLNVALSNCELTVELPGSTAFLEKIALKNVPPRGTFEKEGVLFVTSPDTRRLVATFMSAQLPIVNATKNF